MLLHRLCWFLSLPEIDPFSTIMTLGYFLLQVKFLQSGLRALETFDFRRFWVFIVFSTANNEAGDGEYKYCGREKLNMFLPLTFVRLISSSRHQDPHWARVGGGERKVERFSGYVPVPPHVRGVTQHRTGTGIRRLSPIWEPRQSGPEEGVPAALFDLLSIIWHGPGLMAWEVTNLNRVSLLACQNSDINWLFKTLLWRRSSSPVAPKFLILNFFLLPSSLTTISGWYLLSPLLQNPSQRSPSLTNIPPFR